MVTVIKAKRKSAVLTPSTLACLSAMPTINITAGHSDESVARAIVEAIWEANGAFCKVHVGMRDLDADFPSYSWDEASFDKWQQGKGGE